MCSKASGTRLEKHVSTIVSNIVGDNLKSRANHSLLSCALKERSGLIFQLPHLFGTRANRESRRDFKA